MYQLDQLANQVLENARQIAEVPVAVAVSKAGDWAISGDVDHVFRLASVTKPIFAYSALVAIEEDSLQLEMPVSSMVASQRGSDTNVPIERLPQRDDLSKVGDPSFPEHSSRAEFRCRAEYTSRVENQAWYGLLSSAEYTVANLLSHSSGLSLDNESVTLARPGDKRIYSNAGYEVLGELLKLTTGMSIETYLAESVCRPLSMSGFKLEGSPASHGFCSMTDFVQFVSELREPTLITKQMRDLATNTYIRGLRGVVPGYGSQQNCDWGLGFEIRANKSPHWMPPNSSELTFGHFGRSGTYFWRDPVHDCAAAVFFEKLFDRWAVDSWSHLNGRLFENLTY